MSFDNARIFVPVPVPGGSRRRSRLRKLAGFTAILAGLPGPVLAQHYPARPVRLIVPFAPGGGVDTVARLIGQRLSESFGQAVVVDNRLGAGGVVGCELAARAAPDGHTLLVANNSTHGANQALTAKLAYDTVRDFTPISLIASAPHALVTGANVPARSVSELVALARSKPGYFNYGSAGSGSQTHISGELFNFATGTRLVHIPYKGVSPGFTALLGGEIHLLFASTPSSLPFLQDGRIRAIGITGVRRSQLLPSVPTLLEQGVKGFETGPWYGLLGPARLPQTIVARLQQEIAFIVQTTDTRARLHAQGAEPVGSGPDELARTIREEIAKWTQLVKDTGLRVQ